MEPTRLPAPLAEYTVTLTFEVALHTLSDDTVARLRLLLDDAEGDVGLLTRWIQAIGREPQAAAALAVRSVALEEAEQLEEWLGEYLPFIGRGDFHAFLPSMAHLALRDQDRLVELEQNGDLSDYLDLLLLATDVWLQSARVASRDAGSDDA